MEYKLPYSHLFGGVVSMTKAHFYSVNGFPNSFFGWGGEDDNMFRRLKYYGKLKIQRIHEYAKYTMMAHLESPLNENRWEMSKEFHNYARDGLSTLKYEVIEKRLERLYTHIKVKLIDLSLFSLIKYIFN